MKTWTTKAPAQRLSIIISAVFLAVCAYTIVKYMVTSRQMMAPLGLVGALFLFINPLADRIFKIKLGDNIGIILKIYYLLAFVLGTALRWYEVIPNYDKLMHMTAGLIFSLIGFCLFSRFDPETPRVRKITLQIFFALGFSMFVASVWEIFEFTSFLLTGHDSQHHHDTGVFDTMGDTIACLIGSLITCTDYYISIKKHSLLPLTKLLRGFDDCNDFRGTVKEFNSSKIR